MNDVVSRLRDTGFCGVATQQEAAEQIEALEIEVERYRLACHYLAGWLSCHGIDPKEAVKIAYEKAVGFE